jgi:RNA polymerase sigma factor (sigma-70 family)
VQAHAEPELARDPAVEEAFERLYRTYARDVYRYTLAVLRNPADAEDITQTTFLNAYRAYLRGEEPVKPRHWLIKIAHNACRTRHLRAVRRPQEVPLEETIAALPVTAEDAPKVEELLEALGRLPFNQRAALVMRELEGRSYVEIAETLDISVAAVETLIFRARRTLRRDRSLLGALSSVQLPPSLGSFFGGGGGGAVAGGGIALGSGLLVKAAIFVVAGAVAGSLGPLVGARVAGAGAGGRPSVAASPVVSRSIPVAATPGLRTLHGPLLVVSTKEGLRVVTRVAGEGGSVRVVELPSGTAPAGQASVEGASPAVEGTNGPVTTGASAPSASAAALPTVSDATAVVTTTTSATAQVTDAVSGATSSVSTRSVSTPTVSTPTVTTPTAPPLPVETPTVSVSVPPTPTVPSLP